MNPSARVQPEGLRGAMIIARREIRDQFRDWRIIGPIIGLTLFFPLLMNFTAQAAVDFVSRYGADLVGERLIPFLLMVVGFFPISISLVIALESFAGERERLSIEPLLATPLSDNQLYIGKMIASLVPPLGAAYLGIFVYLAGLYFRIDWSPNFELLVQVLFLTAAQAIVMVSGAVVISSQTTSVRAANLLASFIIIPVAMLIVIESMVMFWGKYNVLWLIVVALMMVAIVLGRMGMHLFNREELLGRDIDVLNFKWVWKSFKNSFVNEAKSPAQWYRSLFGDVTHRSKYSILLVAITLIAAYFIGLHLAREFTLPPEILQANGIGSDIGQRLAEFGFFSIRGLIWVLFNNLRAVLLASALGAFTLGILGILLFMVPVGMIGYIAGNLQMAGESSNLYISALVIPHGIFEIPAAILAGAAILQLGLAAVSMPKGSSLGESWISALAHWARISIGLVVPLLLLAALVEVFLTPRIAVWIFSGAG